MRSLGASLPQWGANPQRVRTVAAAATTDGSRPQWPRRGAPSTIPAVARVVILWKRPYRLSPDEAEDWAREEVGRTMATDTVNRADWTPVRAASARHPSDCDWMLEVQLAPGRNAHDFVDDPAAAAWLGDLQQLHLEPRVIAVDGSLRLRPEDR